MSSYKQLPEEYKRFVDSYVHCLNYRKSYQDAYPLVTDANTAKVNGCRLAAKPEVKEAIVEQLKKYSTPKDDTLQKIIALTQFDAADYVNDTFDFDIKKLRKDGYGWLIKSIEKTKIEIKVILMDKDKALENLAKIHMLFNDSATVNVNINQEVSAKQQIEDKLKALDEKLNKFDGDGK